MNLSPGKYRLGGSALAQCYSQLGDQAPDLDSPHLLAKAFDITQGLIQGTVLLHFINTLIDHLFDSDMEFFPGAWQDGAVFCFYHGPFAGFICIQLFILFYNGRNYFI